VFRRRKVGALIAILTVSLSWALPAAPLAETTGFRRMVSEKVAAAKAASRKKDYAAVDAAWRAVLEVDPFATVALEGLVDSARAQGDLDAEALALWELNAQRVQQVADGDSRLERELVKSLERQAEIDPHLGEARELLDDFRGEMAELAADYFEAGLYANSMVCWGRVVGLAAPGSEARAAGLVEIERCLEAGDDFVAYVDVPRQRAGGKDSEWIADHDRKSAKWNRAARLDTPHYRIRTNAGWEVLTSAAIAMEAVHIFYRETWGIVPDPQPAKVDPELRDITVPRIDLNIYATREEYLKRTGSPEWSGGVFKGSEVATYSSGGESGARNWRQKMRTLFHEASHQFMSVAVGTSVPSFVNEGVACLFEGIELLPNGNIKRDLPVMTYLNTIVNKLDEGTLPKLRDVMDPKYDNRPEFYAPRWGIMYYLRMFVDEQGSYVYRDLLQDYIFDFKRGARGNMDEHFAEFFLEPTDRPGIESFDDFEADWKLWIQALKQEASSKGKRVEEYRRQAKLARLKKQHDTALRFGERLLDIDPDDLDGILAVAEASEELGAMDRALYMNRRFLELASEDDERRKKAQVGVDTLDPQAVSRAAAKSSLVGGMAGLAMRYDRDEMPLMAMRTAHDVLELDPFAPSARALVNRLEKETGRSAIRWEQLFNGFDLEGWWSPGVDDPFFVGEGQLVCDYSRVLDADAPTGEASDVSLYRNLFVDRSVQGDWSMETRVRTDGDWELAGICFGAQDSDHFEAIVLRKTGQDGKHNVDFGSFDEAWNFRGGGSYRAVYDPTSEDGVLLRVDVRNREVRVTIDGVPLPVVVDGKNREAIKYPVAALRGDVGLLASRGVTRFSDLRILAGRTR
jgi:tetratricopeptide (TPR) repeat protein